MTINNQRTEVITPVERRQHWSTEEKRFIIQETYLPGMSISSVSRKYDINPSQLFTWIRLMKEGGLKGISSREEVVPKSHVKELERRIHWSCPHKTRSSKTLPFREKVKSIL